MSNTMADTSNGTMVAKISQLRCCEKKTRLMNCRALSGQAYIPTDVEHIANVITHGLWIVPSFIGISRMMYISQTDAEFTVAVIYGLSLILLFTTSTVFHAISYSGQEGPLKNFFHIGDRAVIYVFIASSYTPWLILKDLGIWGVECVLLVWIMAAGGIVYQYTFHEKYKWLETLLYVIIGVFPSIAIMAMKKELMLGKTRLAYGFIGILVFWWLRSSRNDSCGLLEMAVGGFIYMSGVVFFKCDGCIPFAHAIWHCFVTVGALFHYYAVCTYLLGQTNSEDTKLSSPGETGSKMEEL